MSDITTPRKVTSNPFDDDWIFLGVCAYVDWPTRGNLMSLSKSIASKIDGNFYRFLCGILAEQNCLYVPERSDDWKTLFFDLYKIRHIWSTAIVNGITSMAQTESSKINVFARFRPFQETEGKEEEADKDGLRLVTLPLHQRLMMIKMSNNLKSNRQAMKVLMQEGGWFGGRENEADLFFTKSPNSKKKNSLLKQHEDKIVASVQSLSSDNGQVVVICPDIGLREFNFSGVLPLQATQQSTYERVAQSLVTDLINGFNATGIVYGQTGSGKTYSMFGEDLLDRNAQGIIPRACEEIFLALQERTSARNGRSGIHARLAVTYVEIFGDSVTDLLQNGKRCGHSKVAAQRYVLNGAAERVISSMSDVEEILTKGEQQKRRASTALNDRSTRAHSLFIFSLTQWKGNTEAEGAGVTIKSRLFLADLGGSEQVKKSKVDAGALRSGVGPDGQSSTNEGSGSSPFSEGAPAPQFSVGFELGTHMREAVNINLGLLALKKCIEALNLGTPYVPYQDSKLTMLLSDGLGGNSKTSIMLCSNMNPSHVSETVATLRFGERCSVIEKEAKNNATMLAGVLSKIDAEVAKLEKAIQSKERWEMREEVRQDELAEEGTVEAAAGAKEFKKVAVVLGAEEERKKLEMLLNRRAKFTGSTLLMEEEESGVGGDKENSVGSNSSDTTLKMTKLKDSKLKKKVMGFGKEYAELYGLGGKFDDSIEKQSQMENSRFLEGTSAGYDDSEVPATVRARGGKTWVSDLVEVEATVITGENDEEKAKQLESKAKKAKRNRLAYAGFY